MKQKLKNIARHRFVRNLILALCAIIVFVFLVNLSLNIFTRHNKYIEVPDLTNRLPEDVRKQARRSLRIEVNDSLYMPAFEPGVILTQQPEAGTKVKSGRRIFVTVNSSRQKMVRIPYVTGVSLRQAKNNLEVAGLEIDRLEYRQDIATNYVLETRYDGRLIIPGSTLEAEQGSGITLVVGAAPDDNTVAVPKVVGFPLREAKSRLWEAGINVGSVIFDSEITPLNRNEARVFSQTPDQGTRAALGATVNIRLTLDKEKVEEGSRQSDKSATTLRRTYVEEDLRRRQEEEREAPRQEGESRTEQQPDDDEWFL